MGDKNTHTSRARRFAHEAFCTFLAFALTFTCSFSVQAAFASGASATSGDIDTAATSAAQETRELSALVGEDDEGDVLEQYVADLSVTMMYDERETTLGYVSSEKEPDTLELSKKAQTVDLYGICWWNDGTSERNPVGITFESSDTTVVTVDNSGKVTARADGEAKITVSMTKNTQTGEPLKLVVPVTVSGQAGKTITDISIYCPDHTDTDVILFNTVEKSKVYLQFYALVTLEDGTVYDTANGKLSAQDADLEDLAWAVSDSQIGAIESTTGEYRQLAYGTLSVTAYTSDYSLSGQYITVTVEDPDGSDDAHPQDTLTVHIEYESAPEGAITIPDKVYTRSDLASLGTMTETYTLCGSGSASQATGYGVALRNLLVDACGTVEGEDLNAIASIKFLSGADRANFTTSISDLFKTRYCYDAASYVVGVQSIVKSVEPMLAFESNWISVYSAAEGTSKAITNDTQFRLLLGSSSLTDATSGHSIKWINRIEITLAGSAPVGNDEPEEPDDPEDPDDPEEPEKTKEASGGQILAIGGSGGTGGKTSGGAGSSYIDSGAGLAGRGTGSGYSEGSDVQSEASGSGRGAYSIYQVMNPYTANVDAEYAENPFKPFVLPLCLAAVAAGLAQLVFWYMRQRRPLVYVCAQTTGGTL